MDERDHVVLVRFEAVERVAPLDVVARVAAFEVPAQRLEALGVAAFRAQVCHPDRSGGHRIAAPHGCGVAGGAMEEGQDGERAQR